MLVVVLLLGLVVGEEPPQREVAEAVCSSSGCSCGVSSSRTAAGAPIPCLLDVPLHCGNEDFEEALERTKHEGTL